jgi:NAD(P)-dependent dehydrogenase (short-subunit alcohol dehydrogenase family)
MKINLSGKTAVVTGSTAGVGYMIARGLALAGANVVLNGRKAAAVESAVAKLSAEVPQVSIRGVAADVGSAQGCEELLAAQPRADILVNNVGIYESQDFFSIPDSEWTRYFEVNVMSGVRLSRAYLPGMMERYWGRVMFLSSEWALNIPTDMMHYGLTKAAVLSITHGLAKRVGSTGVTVNAILPGPILPSPGAMRKEDQNDLCLTMEETVAAFEMKHHSPLSFPHTATVDEVANKVVYLASPQASGTTGALLHVDGDVIEAID